MYDRRNTNAAALRAIEEYPLTGVGWVEFVSRSGEFVRQDDDYPVTVTSIEIDNVALSRAAELGIPAGRSGFSRRRSARGQRSFVSRSPASATWRVITIGAGSAWAVSVLTSPVPYPLPNTLIWLGAGSPWLPRSSRALRRRDDAPH